MPGSASTELVLAGASHAQENDRRCGPPEDRTRICRALFLVATIDPALHLDDQMLRQRIGDVLSWAITDAVLVAPLGLIDPLETLARATHTLATSADEQSLVDAIALRAQPTVTTPIDEHWRTNCV
ncbi:MAG: hypothetical protein KJN63_00305 [Acidimicrobiia bacterium]|nr:hypothetical protein [Acidimicrobiia bacterium]